DAVDAVNALERTEHIRGVTIQVGDRGDLRARHRLRSPSEFHEFLRHLADGFRDFRGSAPPRSFAARAPVADDHTNAGVAARRPRRGPGAAGRRDLCTVLDATPRGLWADP